LSFALDQFAAVKDLFVARYGESTQVADNLATWDGTLASMLIARQGTRGLASIHTPAADKRVLGQERRRRRRMRDDELV
jgi:hypothetical protein